MLSNVPGSESQRDALAEILRVREARIAELEHKLEMMQSENEKLTSHVKILLAGGKLPVSPITGKVYT